MFSNKLVRFITNHINPTIKRNYGNDKNLSLKENRHLVIYRKAQRVCDLTEEAIHDHLTGEGFVEKDGIQSKYRTMSQHRIPLKVYSLEQRCSEEGYVLNVEEKFVQELEYLLAVTERHIKSITAKIADKCAEDMPAGLEWINKPFVVLTFDEAVDILKRNQNNISKENVMPLTNKQRIFLIGYTGVPTFVINWPQYTKSKYTKVLENDKSKVAAFDLLVPKAGTLVTGSINEDVMSVLEVRQPCKLEKYCDVHPAGRFIMFFGVYLRLFLGIPHYDLSTDLYKTMLQ